MKKIVVLSYVISLIALTIYSYSQIDLNLTLSSNKLYQTFQNNLIQLGYFNRLLSTIIYIALFIIIFLFYFLILKLIEKNNFKQKEIWSLILILGAILTFSYPAFSHDLFNYMFDARIVTKYGLNPYQFKALDFPDDLWIRFMHWTHRKYPYGPIWLLISLPFSFLGMQKFTLTLFFFKLMFLGSYLGCSYLIQKILLMSNKNYLLGLGFFAFNPLILTESLLSPHNDSFTLLFILLSIYLLIKNKYFSSLVLMIISAGIKFVSLPLSLVNSFYLVKKSSGKRIILSKIIIAFLVIYLLSIMLVVYAKELLPWYAIPVIGLSALIVWKRFIKLITYVISFGLLLKYIPFLYQGEWTPSSYNTFITIFFALILTSLVYYFFKYKKEYIKI